MANLEGINKRSTLDRPIGLLANGVELYPPSIFNESIYYGEVKDINVINGGDKYDVVNPPELEVIDQIGYGKDAKVYGHLKGKLTEVLVLSPGIGYKQKPSLTLVGGSIKGQLNLETNLVQKPVSAYFIPSLSTVLNNKIIFTSEHNFEDGEEIIYNSNNYTAINGLIVNSIYYVGIIDGTSVSLHSNKKDALEKVNLISGLSITIGANHGIQYFTTLKIKNLIEKVYIKDNDSTLFNKIVRIQSYNYPNPENNNGIDTQNDYIYAENHNFKEKDIVIYNSSGNIISGLSTETNYYVKVIDDNKFKLIDIGNNLTPNEENYIKNNYVNLNSTGSGTHTFQTPKINIKVEVIPGDAITIPPIIEPIVLGEYENVFIENNGVGYGLSEVINSHLRPDVRIKDEKNINVSFQSNATLSPVIVDGKIVDVIILNNGKNYGKDTEIVIEGDGKYAKLYPVIQNGKVIDIKILSQGVNYTKNNTKIYAVKRGTGAKFLASVKKWTVDQCFKHKNTIKEGIIIPSKNVKNSLQYVNIIPSDELRSTLKDDKTNLSPIIGWAYDGNPIIGPYIEATNQIIEIRSSYSINPINSILSDDLKRPPLSIFPNGYFIDDYEYIETKSELDENNGKFIENREEFPNGTYAYFVTSEYPYVIGSSFTNIPNQLNFDLNFNQNIEISNKNYIKNTNFLYLESETSGYDYIKSINEKYKQDLIVKNVLGSSIDDYKIINSGENYKVNDEIVFSTTSSQDLDIKSKVSKLLGKPISNINIRNETNSVRFENRNNLIIGITDGTYHGIKDNEIIHIKDSNNLNLFGDKKVKVLNKTTKLVSEINSFIGITTYIEVDDIVGFEIGDYIKIKDEKALILEISEESSKFYIHRLTDKNTHNYNEPIELLPRKFYFDNFDIKSKLSRVNRKYFNPRYSIGIGTTGTYVNNTDFNKSYYIPPKTIYIKNHEFDNNQKIIYNYDTSLYSGLIVSNTSTSTPYSLSNGQILYVIKSGPNLIGLSTSVDLSSPLYFRNPVSSDNEIHSFTFESNLVTGDIENWKTEITTLQNHELTNGDKVRINAVDEDSWENYLIKFDLNEEYNINVIDSDSFYFNIKKPSSIKEAEKGTIDGNNLDILPSNVYYSTNSLSAKGGISNIDINYSNISYKDIPKIDSIKSDTGKGAVIIPLSSKIGKIDDVDRIKDGFDYPSDPTVPPKLGINSICYVTNNKKVSKINILNGGTRYNTSPNLKVIGNDEIILKTSIKNGTVYQVKIEKTPNNLINPLPIISVNNSNGYDIKNITILSSNLVRLTVDSTQFPFIYSDYKSPVIDFPFKVGDSIFIENCKIKELNKLNYNSIDNNYSFYRVSAVNPSLGTIDYEASGNFGTYDLTSGYGVVTNKNSLAIFEMELETCDYLPNEIVTALDDDGIVKFRGVVPSINGWNKSENKLRLTKTLGKLNEGDILYGEISQLKAKVIYSDSFEVKCKLGTSRVKLNYKDDFPDLNSGLKKIQDSNYYQDFSYSIKGKTQYEEWKEPVKSILHPSGFKEFSDLDIISKAENRLKIKSTDSSLNFNVNIESENSLFTRTNYTIGYENEKINNNTTEKVYFGSGFGLWPVAGYGLTSITGLTLLPYYLNKTNKVIELKLATKFDGNSNYINLGTRNFTFNSQNKNYLGVSTSGLMIGDKIGYSSYHEYPNEARIISIGINSVRTLNPHKFNNGSIIQSLEVKRNLNQNEIVGLSSFKILSNNGKEIYKLTCPSNKISVESNLIQIPHVFETGQLIKYQNIGGNKIGIGTTTAVIGGISTDKLPSLLYVIKISESAFEVSGLLDSSPLNITSSGTGSHIFTLADPNSNTLISIDNLVQSPLYKRNLSLDLASNVSLGSSVIYVNSGINSISSIDILEIEDEYLKIKSIAKTAPNSIEVERGILGTSDANHVGISTVYVNRGNYLIKDDIIYFTSPPFGPSGLNGLEIISNFNGRMFNRTFNSSRTNDVNLILDDISDQFIGVSSFTLTSNNSSVVGLYTNTNSEEFININNNPLIFINNIPQIVNSSFDIINQDQNKIIFIDEPPKIGKIIRVKANNGSGYLPLISAGATVSVSGSGEISQIYLNGSGSGYRVPPNIKVLSEIGSGAVITADINSSGEVINLNIIDPGSGYDVSNIPEIIIDEPIPYYNLPLEYSDISSGLGTDAKITLTIGNDSKIKNFEIIESGYNYKVGDILKVVGILTDSSLTFNEFNLTVEEVVSDTFSGMYPGRMIQFEDISSQFDSIQTEFELFTIINGEKRRVVFKSNNPNIKIENNLLIFINDVLQTPLKSYRYVNGFISFSEPPKEESNCNVLYYQGSIDDTEYIVPSQTIKPGDDIKLEDSERNEFDSSQESRVVRRLVTHNGLDTFPYSGPGMDENIVKPISWTKQKNDKLINGSLISKSRENQSSKIYPHSKLIKSVGINDNILYVDNAYPLFVELDGDVGQIIEEKRNIKIIENNNFEVASFITNVSYASTINSIQIINSGNGYDINADAYVNNPINLDPLYQWNFTSGISTTESFNSIAQGEMIVAVGDNNLVAISTDLNNWEYDNSFNNELSIDLKKVISFNQQSYIMVGTSGSIFMKQDKNTPWSICGIKTEVLVGNIVQGVVDSDYVGTFNDVIYNENINVMVAVGDSGKIYYSNEPFGYFLEARCQNFDYKSIDYNSDIMIAVGIGGVSYSNDGINWYNSNQSGNHQSITWDGDKFIISSNNLIKTSIDNGLIWNTIIPNLNLSLKSILKYGQFYIGLNSDGNVYVSYDLINWNIREKPSLDGINDISSIKLLTNDYLSLVGTSGTIYNSLPVLHKADIEVEVANGQITNIIINDGGFGYTSEPSPKILVDSPKNKIEIFYSIKAVGDYGKIVGIKTSNTGVGTDSPSISFELLSDYSDSGYASLNTYGITHSNISVGDYFIISNSNLEPSTGEELVGISTLLGGMSNYPDSKVCVINNYLDGVYRVDYLETTSELQGIVTVTCHFVPPSNGIGLNTSGVTTNYYGDYSWSKIFDFRPRKEDLSFVFNVDTDNGIEGVKNSPDIIRVPPLLF